jgi:putative membrane protein
LLTRPGLTVAAFGRHCGADVGRYFFPVRFGLIAIAVGGFVVIALVAWFGARTIGFDVLRAGWVVPFTTALLFLQLWLSAVAWRLLVGVGRPRLGRWFRIRWIREAVNSMLPVAQLGGNIVGIRLLMHREVPGPLAGAGTTLDLTIEASAQLLFTIAGFAVLASTYPNNDWMPWVRGGIITGILGIGGFIVAQRAGLLRLVEGAAGLLRRFFPDLPVEVVLGLHDELMRLQGRRGAIGKAAALHMLSWTLGTGESWLALHAMGVPVGLASAFVIESLGQAARSAGFAVPGALGVQEAGYILVCELFGIPPDIAIALSMVKRVRELAVGLPGLVAWQWAEGKRLLRRPK